MKFRTDTISGLLHNEGDVVGQTIRGIEPDKTIVVSTGFGVRDALPLRFLAYCIPAIHLLKQLPQSATIEFYIALHGVLRANPTLQPTAPGLADTMRELITSYTRRFHPEQSGQVTTLIDRYISTYDTVHQLMDRLAPYAWQLYEKDQPLRNFADKRGGSPALRYMAEHALYMRDPLIGWNPSWLLVEAMQTDMNHIIMIGGPAEKIFFRVRQHLMEHMGCHNKWQSHQFFTPIGEPPTYHPQACEPLWNQRPELQTNVGEMLTQASQGLASEYRKTILRDLLILLLDAGAATANETVDFRTQEELSLLKQGNIGHGTRFHLLQRGWEQIRSL